MHPRMLRVFAAGTAMTLAGCATILRGTQTELEIETRPHHARVWVDGIDRGEAPLTILVASNTSHTITVRAPGYQEVTANTERILAPGYIVLDVVFGVAGLAVDAVTGAWYTAEPHHLRVMLTPEGSAPRLSQAKEEAPSDGRGER